ncbi:DEAD/DEAH box helicase family protein [Bacillus marinisedimentorum]|uniref:DEAD/DEAH box helicase family protein n=1 Tax=Bacillus marinisedimentorum TaxID=1821260 RepID=UPI0007E11765|nr:DEAD/DEAH box helicase family protein [Bacillus marinisedimentorum]
MSKIKLVTENVQNQIIKGITESATVYILTSFVMKSGVQLLKPYLLDAAKRGADIKICTGDYLFVSHPEALKELLLPDYENVEVRLWRSNGTSFHPKAYLFKNEEEGTFIVGSSNLSRSALTTGVEWNLVMERGAELGTYEDAVDRFLKVFYDELTIPVNEETVKAYEKQYEQYHLKHPHLARSWAKQEEIEMMIPAEEKNKHGEQVIDPPETYDIKIEPRPAQKEALEALNSTIEEDYNRAMVVMATGLGKTYLAAFWAKKFKRVLFIAHREEILHQAHKSFNRIIPDRTYGIYNGRIKEGSADTIFASIYTLSMKEHLANFPPDHFDLIIVDEFHHAAAKSYERVLNHFKPQFLLGITATPDRMDGKDVYAICDGNVAFQMHFIEAIQHGWLAPFHYYGVYDGTDYSQITWLGTKYDQAELLAAQLRDETAENIIQAWYKHKQTRTIGFCSSIKQAQFLSDYFNRKGYQTISLHSQTVDIGRSEAIQKLEKGEIDVIFTVDLFNEGVDIPPVDTLLFVRPTESLTVFTQQVGRGLRLHDGKQHCTIIDLIGNYRNADIKLSLFDTERADSKQKKKKATEPVVPKQCKVDLDVKVINLLDELAKKKQPRKEKLRDAYFTLKEELGRRPTYLEMHLHGNVNTREYKQEFKSFAGFLYWANELSEHESEVYRRYREWLEEVERTGMAKSYKMVLLKYMLSRGEQDWYKPVTPEEVAPFFHRYLTEKEYRKRVDFSDKKTRKLWEYDRTGVSNLIAKMPMSKWSGSSKGITVFENNIFKLNFSIDKTGLNTLFSFTYNICNYRLQEYFSKKDEMSV